MRPQTWASIGFFGGYLLDRPAPGAIAHANEGGTAFVNNDISRLNPAYFQWMDRRIAYCNTLGIVPDIGLGVPSQGLFHHLQRPAAQRVWRYVVARYAGDDVCWNLASRDDAPVPAKTASKLETVAALTRLYDPYQHPITTITPGLLALPAAPRVAGSEPVPTRPRVPWRACALPARQTTGGMARFARAVRAAPKPRLPCSPPDTFDWQDVITLRGGDLRSLDALYSFDRPVVLTERAASEPSGSSGTEATGTVVDPDIARQRRGNADAGRVLGRKPAGAPPRTRPMAAPFPKSTMPLPVPAFSRKPNSGDCSRTRKRWAASKSAAWTDGDGAAPRPTQPEATAQEGQAAATLRRMAGASAPRRRLDQWQ